MDESIIIAAPPPPPPQSDGIGRKLAIAAGVVAGLWLVSKVAFGGPPKLRPASNGFFYLAVRGECIGEVGPDFFYREGQRCTTVWEWQTPRAPAPGVVMHLVFTEGSSTAVDEARRKLELAGWSVREMMPK